MDYTNTANFNPWEAKWKEDDYLQSDPHLDITSFLRDEINQKEDGLLCMFDEMTPVKACGDFNYHVPNISGNMSEGSEECRESLQLKRRRMLQFNSNITNPYICNEQTLSACVELKDWEDPLEDTVPENMQYVAGIPEDDRRTSVDEGLDQSQERFLATCFNDNEMHYNYGEMNASGASYDKVEISDISNIQPVGQTYMIQEEPSRLASRSIFKVMSGRESYMQTPTTTSVAYPFALIKPCGVEDVTLKDINQRIRTPPVRLKHKEEGGASSSHPTSAFSGKPVVVKTRIRTEGGKGSITIMRTKG